VEQLLRLGVALPGGAFCCTVKAMLAMSPGTGARVWAAAAAAGLWLSLAQDGGPGGGMDEADTGVNAAGCWGSSN